MAKRGRKPKPTALKKLEGNPGKRPLNELEPMPQVTMLRCPNWLEPEAKKEWRRLAPVLIGLVLAYYFNMAAGATIVVIAAGIFFVTLLLKGKMAK